MLKQLLNQLQHHPILVATDTVFGVAAPITEQGIHSLYALKKRCPRKPLPIMVASLEAAADLIDIPEKLYPFLQQAWPGPLTFIAQSKHTLLSQLMDTATLGIRIPSHPLLLSLLKEYNKPLAVTSANISNDLTVSHEDHINPFLKSTLHYLPRQEASLGIESTVVLWSNNQWHIARLGGLPKEQLESFAPTHYTPPAASSWLHINQRPADYPYYIGFGQYLQNPLYNLSMQGCVKEACKNLYPFLHKLRGASTIHVGPLPNNGLGLSITDTLLRTVAPRDGLEPPTK